jgi:hypothetical protein
LIFIAFISFSRGAGVEGSDSLGTESIVAASNRIIHQSCGFPHRGAGAITLAAFGRMITINVSMHNAKEEAKRAKRSKKGKKAFLPLLLLLAFFASASAQN